MKATRYLAFIRQDKRNGTWSLDVEASAIVGERVTDSHRLFSDRTQRSYASPGDAATSLRHVLNEFERRRRCRVCGCTEDDCRQCIKKTGEPCHWVEKDLCSACVTTLPHPYHETP